MAEEYQKRRTVSPCVVLFNGFPGVRKKTIAKAFAEGLISKDISYRFIDNHMLIDPVQAICPGRDKAHYELREKFRKTAFEGIKAIEEQELVVIFTACLADEPRDIGQFMEYAGVAESRGVPLILINVVCDGKTNAKRVCSVERMKEDNTKMVDAGILEGLRRNHTLLGLSSVAEAGVQRIFKFELETTLLSVDESKAEVFNIMEGVAGFMESR
jgi:hypothetical protein